MFSRRASIPARAAEPVSHRDVVVPVASSLVVRLIVLALFFFLFVLERLVILARAWVALVIFIGGPHVVVAGAASLQAVNDFLEVVIDGEAWLASRPVAKAFGICVSTIAIFGLGRFACAASRPIISCNCGACCSSTYCAFIEASAILSEKNNWMPAIISAPMMSRYHGRPTNFHNTPTKATYTNPSRNMVITMRAANPASGLYQRGLPCVAM